MAVTTQAYPLPYGCTLVFHYDDAFDIGQQCGDPNWYANLIDQIAQGVSYYTLPDGVNKFLINVTLHVWSNLVPYDKSPDGNPYEMTFWTFADGYPVAHIYAHFIDYTSQSGTPPGSYRFPASLSHEFGHGYHYWCGWPTNNAWGAVVRDFWNNEVIGSNQYPSGWNEYEAWANAFRYFFGADCTRGISGTLNNGSDPVPAPMQDPANHPEWKKQFLLMGELNAYMTSYGCQAGTLSWQGGTDGYWQFKNNAGVWIAQTSYDTWFEYVWNSANSDWQWQQFSPSYTRP